MKVLHLLQSSHFSGAENVACQIIDMFKDEPNIEMAYCSGDGSIRKALDERNIKFYPIKKLNYYQLKRIIKEFKPDIIHAHDMRASFIASLFFYKVKVIAHIHNSDFQARKISVKSLAFLIASWVCKKIFWVSKSCFNSYVFCKLVNRKSVVLKNVLNQREIMDRASIAEVTTNHDIVFIGRLADPKNPQRLIRIISKIKEKKQDISVGVIGTGDLEKTTRDMVEDLNLGENVNFYGFLSNPLGILRNSKVLVITSDREGLPMVSLEALSLGIPIVSTPIDGLCDIIENGFNGYLESEENVFAEKVLNIVLNNEKRILFSKGAMKTFEKINDVVFYKDTLREAYNV